MKPPKELIDLLDKDWPMHDAESAIEVVLKYLSEHPECWVASGFVNINRLNKK